MQNHFSLSLKKGEVGQFWKITTPTSPSRITPGAIVMYYLEPFYLLWYLNQFVCFYGFRNSGAHWNLNLIFVGMTDVSSFIYRPWSSFSFLWIKKPDRDIITLLIQILRGEIWIISIWKKNRIKVFLDYSNFEPAREEMIIFFVLRRRAW